MEQNRMHLSRRVSMILVMGLFCLGVFACTLPRIIELKDPLTSEEHNDLGVAYEHKGMPELAEKEYKTASRMRPDWVVPHFNLGNLHYRSGDHGKAEDAYRKALSIDSNHADTMNNLAYLLYQKGNIQEAGFLIDKALKIAPRKEYLDTYNTIHGK